MQIPKPNKLIIHNIGPIADMTIQIDNKPLYVFFGDLMQGKSTILQSVQLLFSKFWPADIIKHGSNPMTAFVELTFPGGSLRRDFVHNPKTDKIDAELTLLMDNSSVPVKRPYEVVKMWINEFLTNPDLIRHMSGPDRCRFFLRLLSIDTGEADAEIADLKAQQKALEIRIAAFGDINLEPVEKIDAAALRAELKLTKQVHEGKVKAWQKELEGLREQYEGGKWKELRDAENGYDSLVQSIDKDDIEITSLEKRLAEIKASRKVNFDASALIVQKIKDLKFEVNAMPDLKPQADVIEAQISNPLDTSAIEQRIKLADQNEILYAAYEARVAKAQERTDANGLLEYAKARVKELETQKAQQLATAANESGIAGLGFDAAGNFTYEGFANDMLSDSQLERLQLSVRGRMPEGLRLALVDRGEALDLRNVKNIQAEVDRAVASNLTVLVAHTGEAPADAPENVGVFVVQNGKLAAV